MADPVFPTDNLAMVAPGSAGPRALTSDEDTYGRVCGLVFLPGRAGIYRSGFPDGRNFAFLNRIKLWCV